MKLSDVPLGGLFEFEEAYYQKAAIYSNPGAVSAENPIGVGPYYLGCYHKFPSHRYGWAYTPGTYAWIGCDSIVDLV